jgi:hypothetical protein
VAAAIERRWRGIIERAPSALANGQPQEWQERTALRCGRWCNLDHEVSILITRGAVAGRYLGSQQTLSYVDTHGWQEFF